MPRPPKPLERPYRSDQTHCRRELDSLIDLKLRKSTLVSPADFQRGNSMDNIERAFVLIALTGFYGTMAGLTWLLAS